MLTVVLTWTWVGHTSLVQAQTPTAPTAREVTAEDLEKLAAELDRNLKTAEAELKTAPRDTFDPQSILEVVHRDANALFAWVRDRTFYLPYSGSLRGAKGVLMERAGNALDRAILLAEVLQSAGFEVRYARATLSPEQAAGLGTRVKLPPEGWLFAVEPELKDRPIPAQPEQTDLYKAAIVKSQKIAEEAAGRIERDLSLIEATLGQRGKGQIRPAAVDTDHWWVQRKSGETWIDLDPTAADAKPGESVVAAGSFFTMDAKSGAPVIKQLIHHEVVLRLVIEQWKAGKLIEHEVLAHTVRPAQMAGVQVSLKQLPIGWQDKNVPFGAVDAEAKAIGVVGAHKEWRPVLMINDGHISQFSFNTDGDVSKSASDDPVAKFGSGMGQALGGLTGGLGGGDLRPAGKGVLSAQWVEYEIRTPGMATRTLRRNVFDLIGPAARAAGNVPEPKPDAAAAASRGLALMGELDVVVLGGRLSPAWVAYEAGTQMTRARAALVDLIRKGSKEAPATAARRSSGIRLAIGELHAVALARHLWNGGADAVYLDRSNVLTKFRRARVDEGGRVVVREGIDIIENGVAARPGVADPVGAVMRQGVADTVCEVVAVQRDTTRQNVSELVSLAPAAGVKWSAATAANSNPMAQLRLTPAEAARAENDLKSGATLVVPSKPIDVNGKAVAGWYRVDPATGQTLGVLANGEGAASAEYIAMVVQVGVGMLTIYGCGGFAQGVSGGKFVGCLICGQIAGLFAFFFVYGAIAGAAAAGAAGAWAGSTAGNATGLGIGALCNILSGAAS